MKGGTTPYAVEAFHLRSRLPGFAMSCGLLKRERSNPALVTARRSLDRSDL